MTALLSSTCDRCQASIDSDRHLIRIESGSLRQRRPEPDLRMDCFRLFLDWPRPGRGRTDHGRD